MTPFQFFVMHEWKFFVLALLTYFFVWSISHWKEFFDLSGK